MEFLLFFGGFLLEMRKSMVRAKHIRYDVSQVDCTATERECLGELVPASVCDNSIIQYTSRLSTLTKFLRVARGLEDVDPATTTRLEFLQFLKGWKEQGLGNPEATRSALLKLQLARGVTSSFLKEGPVIQAVKGASGEPGPDKHVLEEAEQKQYEDFLLNAKPHYLGGCNKCRMRLDTRDGRLVLLWASRFIQAIPCRLMNLREFQGCDVDEENDRVYVRHLKTAGGGPGYLPCSTVGQHTFAKCVEAAKGRFGRNGDFLFPTCVQKHLTKSLISAAEVFGWEHGLVHTGYCLRHTGMRSRRVSIQSLLESEEGGVSVSTVKIYNRDNAKRRKLKQD